MNLGNPFVFAKIIFQEIPEAAVRRRSVEKDVLKIYSKFTGEQPCRDVISKKLLYNFIEIILRHGCSPVNLLHIF